MRSRQEHQQKPAGGIFNFGIECTSVFPEHVNDATYSRNYVMVPGLMLLTFVAEFDNIGKITISGLHKDQASDILF
jgi:hypothetical protein